MNINPSIKRRYNKDELESIIKKAAELYQKDRDSYSSADLAGTAEELDIPREYIDAAITALKDENVIREKTRKKRNLVIAVLAIAAFLAAIITIVAIVKSSPQNVLKDMSARYYNQLATLDEQVRVQAAQLENVIQRRFDLIPNLTAIVREYAEFEKSILASANQAKTNYQSATTVIQKNQALDSLNAALDAFTKGAERIDTIEANELYQSLLFEIAGSENRIAMERRQFNDAVSRYNTFVRQKPLVDYVEELGFDREKEYWGN